ncbi:hypothetical protein GEV33_006755 [Tenebrio molitor]|uniref:Uncharacterized protein n=1 Tax=Tenebrio molitor TaxID=7067 RepID=A0A8J6LJG0_TENMO|nr:hypothetical protein GEV33_006755 [Tenebrio molitor]
MEERFVPVAENLFLAVFWVLEPIGFASMINVMHLRSLYNSCFPFGQKNRSELLLSLKPHVQARTGHRADRANARWAGCPVGRPPV